MATETAVILLSAPELTGFLINDRALQAYRPTERYRESRKRERERERDERGI